MDIKTFGNSKAAQTLVKILNELDDPKIASKVSYLFHSYNTGLKSIKDIKDRKVRRDLLLMWKNKFIKTVGNKDLPKEVQSYLLNIITRGYKIIMREEKKVTTRQYRLKQINSSKI